MYFSSLLPCFPPSYRPLLHTVIIHRVKNSLSGADVGITVDYGVGLWLYWASTGCLLLAVLPCELSRYTFILLSLFFSSSSSSIKVLGSVYARFLACT